MLRAACAAVIKAFKTAGGHDYVRRLRIPADDRLLRRNRQ